MTSSPSARLGSLVVSPPLVNSSSPWCSDLDQLADLCRSPSTGAVTTRTATLRGFAHDPKQHGHTFLRKTGLSSLNTYGYSPHPLAFYLAAVRSLVLADRASDKPFLISITSSDPIELRDMMLAVQALRVELADGSGSGDTSDVNDAPNEKGGADGSSPASDDGGRPVNGRRRPSRIGLEINTSCPNIPGQPPPSYAALTALPALLGPTLRALPPGLTLGLKLPPFVHAGQFAELVRFLEREACGGDPPLAPPPPFISPLRSLPTTTTAAAAGQAKDEEDETERGHRPDGWGTRCRVAYLACCNTLGGCLGFPPPPGLPGGAAAAAAAAAAAVEEQDDDDDVAGDGAVDLDRFGGLAGEGLHPLALGNVRRLSLLLRASPTAALHDVALVGIGGATTVGSVRRFFAAGASAVAVATALGARGVGVFDELVEGCRPKGP